LIDLTKKNIALFLFERTSEQKEVANPVILVLKEVANPVILVLDLCNR